jgi:hypothetical protein
MWRGLETGSRRTYTGTKLETADTAKGSLRSTAPVLDPTVGDTTHLPRNQSVSVGPRRGLSPYFRIQRAQGGHKRDRCVCGRDPPMLPLGETVAGPPPGPSLIPTPSDAPEVGTPPPASFAARSCLRPAGSPDPATTSGSVTRGVNEGDDTGGSRRGGGTHGPDDVAPGELGSVPS